MAVRIRYQKTSKPNVVMSVRTYSSKDGEYRVFLDLADKKFKILGMPHEYLAAEGDGISLAMLKLKAKRALVLLGVAFEGEGRST